MPTRLAALLVWLLVVAVEAAARWEPGDQDEDRDGGLPGPEFGWTTVAIGVGILVFHVVVAALAERLPPKFWVVRMLLESWPLLFCLGLGLASCVTWPR